jgi:hypothetical protein
MHRFVRHEIPQMDAWKFPPASLTLNAMIVNAIDHCLDGEIEVETLELSLGDLLLLDFVIPQDVSTGAGAKGFAVLVKTFSARRQLDLGLDVALTTAYQVPDDGKMSDLDHAKMEHWKNKTAAGKEATTNATDDNASTDAGVSGPKPDTEPESGLPAGHDLPTATPGDGEPGREPVA